MRYSNLGFCFLFFVLMTCNFAVAQETTESFDVTVDTVIGGSSELRTLLLGSSGSGTFTYDAAALTGASFESINADQGLTLELDVFGQTFTETDDRDFSPPPGSNDFPVLSFLNGVPFNLSFRVFESPFTSNPANIQLPGVNYFEFNSSLSPNQSGGFDSTLFVIAVPEPSSTMALFGGAIACICFRRRKH